MKNFLAIFLGAPGSPKFAEFMAMEEGKRNQQGDQKHRPKIEAAIER